MRVHQALGTAGPFTHFAQFSGFAGIVSRVVSVEHIIAGYQRRFGYGMRSVVQRGSVSRFLVVRLAYQWLRPYWFGQFIVRGPLAVGVGDRE